MVHRFIYPTDGLKRTIASHQQPGDSFIYTVKEELNMLSDLRYIYTICNTNQKQQLIKLGFDNRLYYFKNTYPTPYIMPIYTHNSLNLKEKGLLIIDEQPFKNGNLNLSGAEGSRTPVQTNPP